MATLPQSTASPSPAADHHPGLHLRDAFRRFATWTSTTAGSPWTFVAASLFLVLWALSYPLFLKFPDPFNTWQLVINTVTTIVTFLMVFLIQNTQNRDAKAMHMKLDELIRSQKGARNRLVELENCTDEELEELRREFERIHRMANSKRERSTSNDELSTLEMEQQIRRTDAKS